ncbi:MAG TPA: type II toxin-antitoxin system Phd/YefM family antitoxin [Pseudonocardia sp.]|jgi:prevent-host-death family protein|uniref:type II toxin-antitoxin system Phd/YefM family antitoxin n=1 Tax=Pseudonocardia sp. TaxID=60912 RepID=UPI002F3F64E9
MSEISVSDARGQLPEVIDTAQNEAVVLQRHGRPVAVVISPGRYEELMDALEAAEDIAAFDAAMAEEDPSIPWEQVKADLGL